MHKHWKETILPIIEKIKPKHIVEVGSDTGINTRNILEYCETNNAKLTSIDPSPNFDVDELKERYACDFEFYKDLSLNILPFLEKFDIILIDGDHNWYTVFNELNTIEKIYKKNNNFPLIFLHDTAWPYGRRDLYYFPENIPEEYLLPYEKLGMIPGEKKLSKDKGMNQNFNNALLEGGEKNGVLTAIEDYIEKSSLNLTFYSIPAFYGLGILFLENQELKKNVEDSIDYSSIIENLEKHYLKLFSVNYKTEKNNLIKNLNNEKRKFSEMSIEKDNTIKTLTEENTNATNQIKTLTEENTNATNQIKTLTEENTKLQQNNTQKDNTLKTLTEENTKLQQNNTQKDRKINDLLLENELYLNRTKILVKNKEEIYFEQQNTLEELKTLTKEKTKATNQIKTLTEENTKLQQNNTQKDNTIKTLTKEKTTMKKELTNSNNDLKSEIELLNTKLSDYICIRNKQNQEILDLNMKLKCQQEIINQQNIQINEYESSTSWNVTKPFRKLKNILNFKNNR